MKTYTLIVSTGIFTLLIVSNLPAQTWCVPPTGSTGVNSYGSNSPVITNVTLNTINRTTAASLKELYVNTGQSTTLVAGQSYPFSMTYTMDLSICNVMSIRVWIDWNLNYSFSDAGETELTADGQSSLTYTGTITVPSSATLGTTRMRVGLKMDGCGHNPPDACVPSESFGWHGEIEDYSLVVTSATGILSTGNVSAVQVFNNSETKTVILEGINNNSDSRLTILNMLGREIITAKIPAGTNRFSFGLNDLSPGVYFCQIAGSGKVSYAGKLIVQ
ncbi:MAG: T9SS type A sorting domain-containing protein [Bacteroidetes bacterium]|nr:T9SS type A sorting domain-containing protein [Bacteroidota bacterium]